ncbi:MerR family transcriptional regulator [Conexibacter woesei]|uniref:Transcriptional regulator, MerR family n=1 Tax=Conexibacter woesei (strain DSM 14684 / CCUG 47730 / CIP 108061 / JCM 11494 / NBRC 100937 / ID131577) TaxID=469383 RepID=D3F7G3_CONWI|nr:MerR family transcriptional regulator [Conexibacter woesei]ADB50825.1 transcriptional regulator, MerR family [Conexibacter woesei DSM 14684]
MTDSHLLAGRFGAAARLSPKALRLYADQGLLVPAYIDPDTGYRYYARDQVPRARLIARLRRLGLPMARVAQLLELTPATRVIELQSWLQGQHDRLADQTELVEALARQVDGGEPDLTAAVGVRDVAACKVVYQQRHVSVEQLEDVTLAAETEIRAHLRASGLPGDGPMSVHFHEPVSRDGERLIEVAVDYDGSVEPAGDLRLRLQPAHRAAYVPVPAAYEDFPLVLRVYDAVEAWLDAREDVSWGESPYERYPGSGGTLFDVAYPLDAAERP